MNNETLLNELQQTVDNAQILEQADEILEIVRSLDDGDYEQLHDDEDRAVVRVYRTAFGFNLHSTAYDIPGNGLKANFRLSDYESSFETIEDGYDFEAAQGRRELRREERSRKQATKQELNLTRFLHIEKAYEQGEMQSPHPYLERKGIAPEDVRIEYSVVTTPLFQRNSPLNLLIYKLSEDAYQVITPTKMEINGNWLDKFNIIRHEGAMKGTYAVVGDGEPEFVVEGLADAISANMAIERPIAIGLNAGNIKHIADALPELILIGDNDDAGRLSAEKSGLDAIFCTEHKDIDDMRKDKGLVETRRFLEQEIRRIERDREPLLGDIDRSITLVSAPPGTGKSYHECLHVIRGSGLTVYAVHSKQAMGQEESRVTMIRDICRKNQLDLPTIRRVNSSESEDNICSLFNRIIDEYRADDSDDKNWVVFITHQGLSMLKFDLEGLNANLVIDEVPDAYHIHHQAMSAENLNTYLNYFSSEVREYSTHYIVKILGLNTNGLRFMSDKTNKSNMETRLYWALLDKVSQSRNHTKFLFIERGDCKNVTAWDGDGGFNTIDLRVDEQPKISNCEVFDIGNLDHFSSVRMLSDDCENSVLALLLSRTQGVKLEVERLASRHLQGVANRIERIIGVTDQTFSKHKLDTRPELSNHIARAISEECDLFNSLWLLNNSSRENGDGITYLKDQRYEIDDYNPMTHGRNDLTRFDTVIMLYSLKPSPVESALMESLGISSEEMTRWREHNVHMQNSFRCFLRNPSSSTTGTLVFPDKASIDYFLNRVEAEWGEEEKAALVAKVMYLDDPQVVSDFENKPAGRRQSGDGALTPSQRVKLSKWRNSKGLAKLNEFSDTFQNGLKGLASMRFTAVKSLYDSWLASLSEARETRQISDMRV